MEHGTRLHDDAALQLPSEGDGKGDTWIARVLKPEEQPSRVMMMRTHILDLRVMLLLWNVTGTAEH